MQRTRHPGRALAGWGLVVTAAVVIVGLRGPAGAQEPQLGQGAQIYQQQCAQCHGGDGQGGTVTGTDLPAPPMRGLPVAYVDLVLHTGRMPPVGDPFDNRLRKPTVTGEAREALVAWMDETFGLTGGIPQAQPGDAATGLQMFGVQCAHCHGATGAGGIAGAGAYTPSITGYEPVVIAEAVRIGPFEMPAFSPEQITDEEIDGIVAFLTIVEEERRTPIFGLIELNPVYAAGFVALLALVLLFSLFWIGGTPAWFPDPRRDDQREEPGGTPPIAQEDT